MNEEKKNIADEIRQKVAELNDLFISALVLGLCINGDLQNVNLHRCEYAAELVDVEVVEVVKI
jgi:hypothetical protein